MDNAVQDGGRSVASVKDCIVECQPITGQRLEVIRDWFDRNDRKKRLDDEQDDKWNGNASVGHDHWRQRWWWWWWWKKRAIVQREKKKKVSRRFLCCKDAQQMARLCEHKKKKLPLDAHANKRNKMASYIWSQKLSVEQVKGKEKRRESVHLTGRCEM